MRLKNDPSDMFYLMKCIKEYYKNQNRAVSMVGDSDSLPYKVEDRYYVDFLVDKKHVLRYAIPIDDRNFFACVWIGMGPCFIYPSHLMEADFVEKFSIDSTTEAIERNLALLDEYFKNTELQ